MSKFEYLPDVATADIAFRAEGNTLNELFENSALATSSTIMDLSTVKQSIIKEVEFEEDNLEELLFAFLSEIIFYKDADNLFFSRFEVQINNNKLCAKMYGEEFNKNMGFKNDVKAITMHMLKVEKKDKYYATVVVDI